MADLKKIIIDGTEIEVDPAMTLIQACEEAGIEVPRFCYHERLTIAGNCRMCLVEVVGGPPKPAASCAMQVRDLRPGPEGQPPVVKTNSPMVKKAREGVMEFLLINHPLDCPICDQGGECDLQDQAMADAEITSYLGETLDSNLQGNIIDLCPVGALVSKPYAFTARPWELTKTESIDVMDAMGSNIRVDTKGREVMRFLPRNHDGVNEEWISDKTRFVWDGLRRQRLDTPYIRENGKLRKASWPEALSAAAAAMSGKKVAGLVGDLAPTEAAYALKTMVEGLGGHVECRTDNAKLPAGNRGAYVGTATIEELDTAEKILLVGTNPAIEMPVLNARIRKAWAQGADVTLVGEAVDLTYDYEHMGTEGKRCIAIVGQGALQEADGEAVLATVQAICEKSGGKLMVLHSAAGRVGAMDVGAVTDGGMKAAIDGDIILPSAAYTEEQGLFVNTEGRPQLALRASFPPGEAKENWAILRALSAELGQTLPFDSMAQLRTQMIEAVPHLAMIDGIPENAVVALKSKKLGKAAFRNAVTDFYLSNPIARASELMAELSANAKARAETRIAAE